MAVDNFSPKRCKSSESINLSTDLSASSGFQLAAKARIRKKFPQQMFYQPSRLQVSGSVLSTGQ